MSSVFKVTVMPFALDYIETAEVNMRSVQCVSEVETAAVPGFWDCLSFSEFLIEYNV